MCSVVTQMNQEEDRLADTKREASVRVEQITRTILLLRGQRVILDAELATLYDVTTKALNQAVKRNAERFPDDFMFRLTRNEIDARTGHSL